MEKANWWMSVLFAGGGALAAFAFGAYYAIFAPTDDLKKLGIGLITAALSAVFGFVAGRASKK